MYLRAVEGYEYAEGEHEADILYLRKQLSACKVRKRDRLLGIMWKR